MLRHSDKSRRTHTKSSNVYGESQPKRVEPAVCRYVANRPRVTPSWRRQVMYSLREGAGGRKRDLDQCAGIGRTLDRELRPVGFDQRLRQRQAQSGSGCVDP